MECAIRLKQRGHNPIIYEKSDKLGGVFIPASSESYKGKLRDLLAWYIREVKNHGIEVKLNHEVTSEELQGFKNDAVVVATGSVPRQLKNVAGYEKMTEACDFLNGEKKIGDNIVVVGGGLTGCEVAYELALNGKKVTIVEMLDDLIKQTGVCLANSSYLREWFELNKVPVYLETSLVEVKDKSVVCKDKNGKSFEIKCDDVISCAGYIPAPLGNADSGAYLVGDCNGIGNLRHVIWRAYEVAMKI